MGALKIRHCELGTTSPLIQGKEESLNSEQKDIGVTQLNRESECLCTDRCQNIINAKCRGVKGVTFEEEAENVAGEFYLHLDDKESTAYKNGFYDACIRRSVELTSLRAALDKSEKEREEAIAERDRLRKALVTPVKEMSDEAHYLKIENERLKKELETKGNSIC